MYLLSSAVGDARCDGRVSSSTMIEGAVLETKMLPPVLTSRICSINDGSPVVCLRHASKYGEDLSEATINDRGGRPTKPFVIKYDDDRAKQHAYLPSQGTQR